MRQVNQLHTRQLERIAATDGHPMQKEAEEELWIRTPPPVQDYEQIEQDRIEEESAKELPPTHDKPRFPAYVKIVIVPAATPYGYGWFIEDAQGNTLASAQTALGSRAFAARDALQTRRGRLPDPLPF